MKLTIPAIRPPAPGSHREEISQQTLQLLAEIDAVLASAEAAAGPGSTEAA